jgi:hypothetical protein
LLAENRDILTAILENYPGVEIQACRFLALCTRLATRIRRKLGGSLRCGGICYRSRYLTGVGEQFSVGVCSELGRAFRETKQAAQVTRKPNC